MTKTDRFTYLLTCAVFGFLGGVIANYGFFKLATVQAGQTPVIVKAQQFQLVDEDGKLRAELTQTLGVASLKIYAHGPDPKVEYTSISSGGMAVFGPGDNAHRVRLFAGLTPDLLSHSSTPEPEVVIRDQNGHTFFVLQHIKYLGHIK